MDTQTIEPVTASGMVYAPEDPAEANICIGCE